MSLSHLIKAGLLGLLLSVSCLAGTAEAQVDRRVVSLNSGWRFLRGDVAGAFAEDFNTETWQVVDLPHTFDGARADKPADYYRGPAWYRRIIRAEPNDLGKPQYIEFDGAALVTGVWINGQKVGRHAGGYARFRFLITPFLKAGRNTVAVRVDNSKAEDVLPLGGDFTLFGGIYRPVRLVTTSSVHFDMMDYGGPGVYFKQSNLGDNVAHFAWRARVANEGQFNKTVTIRARLYDAENKLVGSEEKKISIAANSVDVVDLSASLDHPHFWQGVVSPYLYRGEVEIEDHDKLVIPVGFRNVQFDANKGLLLNGRPYKIYGVNIHQSMRPGRGPAVSDAAVDEDFGILADLGVTGLRFAHYQHSQRDYDLSDQRGYLVWTELPLVSETNSSPGFAKNAADQLQELIRQNMNHPSVIVWGLGNEIYKSDEQSNRLLDNLQAIAHKEDDSRPTTYASCCGPVTQPHASHTDVLGVNNYVGWYSGEFSDLERWIEDAHTSRPNLPLAISEYGAGASIIHQDDRPRRPIPASHWHPEQYQALYHEAAWRQIQQGLPQLWGSFVWVGFDFPSAGRDEGDRAGINDKGLVTFDRKVKKDAFYWYRANWNAAPTLYITSRRYLVRAEPETAVKVYSNLATARMTLNGVDEGEQTVVDHVATWKIMLLPGRNHIKVQSGATSDAVDWIYQPRMPNDLEQ